MNTDNITDLQTRIAFQEDAINTLNELVARQDKDIVHLQMQLQVLNKKFEEVKDVLEGQSTSSLSSASEKPPHY